MTTHIEAVTSVTIDPSGVYLATVGHDCSLRIWNIEDKSCTQEMTAHQVSSKCKLLVYASYIRLCLRFVHKVMFTLRA